MDTGEKPRVRYLKYRDDIRMTTTLDINDYKGMFEKSPLAQAVIDRNLQILAANEAFCRLIGYGRDNLIGVKMTDIQQRGYVTYLNGTGNACGKAISAKQDVTFESRIETRAGTAVLIQSCQPVLDETGEVKFIYNTYTDLTKIVKNDEYMAREIDEFIRVYDRMASGDLTVNHTVSPPEDPDIRETFRVLSKLRESVRGIITNLQANIRDVNERMEKLKDSTENAAQNIEDASSGVKQTAHDATDVSANTEKISLGVEQIARAMQDMSASVEEITASMESVSALSKETNDLSREGATLAGKAELSMSQISEASVRVYTIVGEVEKQMEEISKIVVLIREIANQTNLLALNAAIEAARAGDAGRGFAVVASEVKSLAQESRNSAERIEEMIANLKKNTQNASDAMGETKTVVEQGARMVTETLRSFNQIASAVDKVAKSASEVAAATEEQAATTEEVTASIQEVKTLVDETASDSTDAAAAIEESSAALDEITRTIRKIHALSVDLLETNRKFKVS